MANEKFLEQKLQTAARGAALTPAEKAALKARLLTLIREDSAPAEGFFIWQWRLRTVLLVLALIIPLSSLSLAAEGAVPGDWLYPIKQKVNEPLLRSVTGGEPLAASAFIERQVERRLREAEKLAETSRLNEPAKNQLKQDIAKNLAELAALAGSAEPATAVDATATIPPGLKNNPNLNRILEKHQPVLPALDLLETAQGLSQPAEDRGKIEINKPPAGQSDEKNPNHPNQGNNNRTETDVRSAAPGRQNKGLGR